MPDLTTAQRLAAYRSELQQAGFEDDLVSRFLGVAAPRIEDVEVQADLDDDGTSIGEVRVRLKPHLDQDDLRRIVERAHAVVEEAAQ